MQTATAALSLDNGLMRIALAADPREGLAELVDLRSGRNFVQPGARPLYRMTLSMKGGETREVTSRDAAKVKTEDRDDGLTLEFAGHGDLDIALTAKVRLKPGSNLSRWTFSVVNRTGYGVRSVEFPVMVCPPTLGDTGEDDYYVSGTGFGLLAQKPGRVVTHRPAATAPDDDGCEVVTGAFHDGHYPGPMTVQMQAYYDPEAGLYMATYDDRGCVKWFGYKAAADEDALDLSIRHGYDERPGLAFELPYDTVIGTFKGDWYDAADIYKEWAYGRHWCSRRLTERDDVPAWFKEPRPHMMVISRGGPDRAQATLPSPPSEYPLGKYWPARKLVPLMRRYRDALETPVVVWLEGWEGNGAPGGPVDIFPPYEGEESFKAATAELVRDGHVISMYLAGLHWCYRRPMVSYYGEERFEREGRPLAALNPQGDVDRFTFSSMQKLMVNLCVGSKEVKDLYLRNFDQLMDLGAAWVQLDQQVGLYSAPCYSEAHGHPAGLGRWMYEEMLDLTRRVRAEAKRRSLDGAYTCENACEIWIQEIDAFMDRPYLQGDVLHAIPIFQYVYHPFSLTYGGDVAMWLCHEEVACIKHAMCATYGMQNLVCVSEPDYDIDVEECEHPVLPLLASIAKAQRGFARDYLVFGEMMRPTEVLGTVHKVDFWWPPTVGRIKLLYRDIPSVQHGVWKSPDGRIGHILINWTSQADTVRLKLAGGNRPAYLVTGDTREALTARSDGSGWVEVTVPPRTAWLVEQS